MAGASHRKSVHDLAGPSTKGRRAASSRQSLQLNASLTLLVTACLLVFFLLPGCTRGEPPTAAELQPLVQSCAVNHPVITGKLGSLGLKGGPGVPPGWENAKREVKVLGAPEIGFPIVGYYLQEEGSTFIWPVKLHAQITLHKIAESKAPGKTLVEKERVEKATVLCYAVKDKNDHWRLTALPPTDITPFYQKWWYHLRGAKHSLLHSRS